MFVDLVFGLVAPALPVILPVLAEFLNLNNSLITF